MADSQEDTRQTIITPDSKDKESRSLEGGSAAGKTASQSIYIPQPPPPKPSKIIHTASKTNLSPMQHSASSAQSSGPLRQSASSVAAASSTLPKRPNEALVNNVLMPQKNYQQQNQGEEQKQTKSLPLGQKLINKGLISKDQLETALKEQRTQTSASKKMLGAILIEMGFITESALGGVLTEESGVRVFDVRKAVLDPKLIRQVPKEVALRYKAVPVAIENNTVMVAISDIYNILAIDQIRQYFPTNLKIVPVYGAEPDILEVIDQYHGYETSIGGILKEIETGIAEQKTQLSGEIEGYVNPTVRLVDAILVDAIKRNASDIHFEPEGTFLRIRYRIDGKMVQIRSFHKEYWAAVVVRIKIMSGMNIAETRYPQDGRVSYFVLGREIDFRVATHPTVFGENVVMRILDKHKALLPLEQLGFSKHNEELMLRLLRKPEGIVIVTGPTGSGKTTTLYSVLNHINSIDINIMTLENPVEYQLPMLRQSDVREDKGMDFVSGIKSLLRQDPDVIFVGEIRDEATANMAMRAAMTGHRVFSTLHTNDAFGAIPRLVDIGIPPHLLSGTLICVIAQRLLRRLCTKCKVQRAVTESEAKVLGIDHRRQTMIYVHQGCPECYSTGYRGRVATHEVFPVDKGMDELIATGATRKAMVSYALEKGFIPILQDGINKVMSGMTDVDEISRVLDVTDRL